MPAWFSSAVVWTVGAFLLLVIILAVRKALWEKPEKDEDWEESLPDNYREEDDEWSKSLSDYEKDEDSDDGPEEDEERGK